MLIKHSTESNCITSKELPQICTACSSDQTCVYACTCG